MSNCLHVCIKHEIEYGASGFNWQMDEVKNLLKSAGCETFGELNDDNIGDWEVDDIMFQNAVKKIKKMPKEKIASFFHKDYVGEDLDEFKKDVIELLQKFIDTGDHNNGYYHFSWF